RGPAYPKRPNQSWEEWIFSRWEDLPMPGDPERVVTMEFVVERYTARGSEPADLRFHRGDIIRQKRIGMEGLVYNGQRACPGCTDPYPTTGTVAWENGVARFEPLNDPVYVGDFEYVRTLGEKS